MTRSKCPTTRATIIDGVKSSRFTLPLTAIVAFALLLFPSVRAQFIATAVAQSAPPVPLSYPGRTDRNTASEPALPTMGPRGSIITDATFGNRILRVTDGSLVSQKPNREWFTAGQGSAEALDFNADNTRFLVDGPGGETLAFDFTRNPLTATRIPMASGWGVPVFVPVWDPINRDVVYGSMNTSMYSYNVATQALTEVWNMSALGDSLRSTSIGNNRRLIGFVGYQNTAPIAAAKDLNTGQTWILNTQQGTLNGVALPGFTSFTIHNIRLGQDGRYAVLTPGAGGAGDMAIWDIDGGTVKWCGASCGGHKTNAYGWLLNQDNLVGAGNYFGYEVLKRPLTSLATGTELVTKPASSFVGTDMHYSWGNAQSSVMAPVIASSSGEPLGTGPVTGAWDREIIAMATDGSNTVYRLAHTRSLFTRFEDGPHATISRDGLYVLFGSNWGLSLGPNESGQPRIDVFLLELKGSSTPPPSDTTMPTVSITGPMGGVVSGSVTVSATASDNVGVVGVQMLVDGAPLGAEDMAGPYQSTWATTGVADGNHTVSARARDLAGNIKTSSAMTVTVSNIVAPPTDTIWPTAAVTSPLVNANVAGTVSISATAGDNVGVVGVQFQIDGLNLGAEDTVAPYQAVWDTSFATNGIHNITATSRDAAGHTTRSSLTPVTVNNATGNPLPAGPIFGDTTIFGDSRTLTAGSGIEMTAGSASLLREFGASDGVNTLTWRVSGTTATALLNGVTVYTGTASSSTSLRVQLTGNVLEATRNTVVRASVATVSPVHVLASGRLFPTMVIK